MNIRYGYMRKYGPNSWKVPVYLDGAGTHSIGFLIKNDQTYSAWALDERLDKRLGLPVEITADRLEDLKKELVDAVRFHWTKTEETMEDQHLLGMRNLVEALDSLQNRRLTEVGPYGNPQKAVGNDIDTAVPGRREHIPFDFHNITKRDIPGDLPAEIYTYEKDGSPYAIMFGGRRTRPDKHYRYSNAERREEAIDEYLSAVMTSIERKERTKAERNAYVTSLKPGDILVSSWGYDQTNIDFYQIIGVTTSGKSVRIRKIAKRPDDEQPSSYSPMSDHVVPIRDEFVGPVMTKRVTAMSTGEDWISISSYEYARKWDGEAAYRSWYN